MSLVRNVKNVTYSNNCSQSSESWKWVFDVLKVNLSSSEWASTLLPAGVLATELLGEVFRGTDLILTKTNKHIKKRYATIKMIKAQIKKRFSCRLSREGMIIECPLNGQYHDRRDVILTSQMAVSNNFLKVTVIQNIGNSSF